MNSLIVTAITTTSLFLLIGYFAGPWIIAEKRNCTNKKTIKILTIVTPILFTIISAFLSFQLNTDSFEVISFIPTAILYIVVFIDKRVSKSTNT